MKSVRLLLPIVILTAVLFASCKDEPSPVGPQDDLIPALAVLDLQERVDLLIEHLYPLPGLRRSAERRWANIQRQMARNPTAAQNQALEMISDALEFLAAGRLQDPDHPDLPVSTARDGVRLLSYYFYSFTGLEGVPEFDPEFEGAVDKGSGWITPEEGGEILTENGWAKLTVAPGETEEDVLITIQLIEDANCDPGATLTTSLGCWDFDHYGGGDFEHLVEICVADPGPPEEPGGMTDSEYYIDLRVHQQEEEEGSIPVALPYVNSSLDCSEFPIGPEGATPSSEEESRSVLAALGSRIADFLLPEAVAAHFGAPRRPPRGIGGLASSFTWYFGALPLEEQEDYSSLPTGAGGAVSWDVETPEVPEDLCTEENPVNCPGGSLTEVEISAVLTEDSGVDPNPWWEVFFYFKPEGEPGPLVFIGSTSDFTTDDNGTNRISTWEVTLNGSQPELQAGQIDVFAVGARGPEEGGEIFATDLASYIDVVSGEVVVPIQPISTMGAGNDYTCALRSDGKAFCWGENDKGQLGDGTLTFSPTPVEVRGGLTFDQLYVSDRTACGLTSSGEAHCWGSNRFGVLGAGLPNTGIDGFALEPVPVSGGHSFDHLAMGYATVCGVALDGTTYCWGRNRFGELGNGTVGGESNVPVPVTNSETLGFVRVSAPYRMSCGLTGTGSPYCWGWGRLFGNDPMSDDSSTPTPAVSGMALSALDQGTGYLCAIDGNQDAYCWGFYSEVGSLGIGTATTGVYVPTHVAGGHSFEFVRVNANNTRYGVTCALKTGGEAWCWGANHEGQLGGPSSDLCTFSGGDESCALSPVPVSGGLSFSAIDVGADHTCGLDTGGNLHCWGDNEYGQLGDGTLDGSPVPVTVVELTEAPGAGPIEVTPMVGSLTLRGETLQLTGVALDQNGNPLAPQPPLSWSSSNPAVAAVDASGLVTAVSDGTAVIFAAAPDGSTGRATVTAQIIDPVWAFNSVFGMGGSTGEVVQSGLLADEWGNSGSFSSHAEIDSRILALDTYWLESAFDRLQTAREALEWEAIRLQAVDPSNPLIGELLTRAGFLYLAFAQNWCSGVPLNDPDVGVSTAGLLDLALARFDEAVAAPIPPEFLTAARLGLARAYQRLGDYAAAEGNGALVPISFSWNLPNSAASGEENSVYYLSRPTRRISVPDAEGTNGLPFRSAQDPRVPWIREDGGTAIGTDGMTPHYDQLKYPTADSPMPLATGIEARLILAEVRLLQNDIVGFLDFINEVRAYYGLSPVVDPGTADERVDLLFSERAFSLYGTGQRLGDLRRLVTEYGRVVSGVYPVGTTIQGSAYGTAGNFPVPASARGSGFSGCTVTTY